MARIELTDLAIRALKARGKQDVYLCSRTPNFGVRVSQKGTKSFFVLLDNPRRRIGLPGKFPATSLQDARKEARRLSVAPPPVASTLTLAEAFPDYLTTQIRPRYRPRSAAEVERLVTRHCAVLAGKTIDRIQTLHLSDILDTMKPSEANHLFGVLRTLELGRANESRRQSTALHEKAGEGEVSLPRPVPH